MSTEIESIGKKLVTAAIKRRVADGSVVGKPLELIEAIDKAIADERERIIAMADALEYELPNFEQMKGVETLRKKLQAKRRDDTEEETQ